jgi:DNA-directed RNA polymerase specialized sigma24 family protein
MTMPNMGDWELLQAYAKNRSETAFAELVRRHLDWVYSVALRQVSDRHLAEDVVQSVFVLLARRSGNLRPGTILGGWLFRTTRFVASHALRTELRRKNRETAACIMTDDVRDLVTTLGTRRGHRPYARWPVGRSNGALAEAR